MKKCPSCNRAYSDTVTRCPICAVELTENSAGTAAHPVNREDNTHDRKVTASGTEQQASAAGWKLAAAAAMLLAVLFMCLYATQRSAYEELVQEHNAANREYHSLSQAYEELEAMVKLYNLEGKYAIELTSVYNGDADKNVIGDALATEYLEYVCMKWTVHGFSEEWGDMIYIDVIRPNGTVLNPYEEFGNHTTADNTSEWAKSDGSREWNWKDSRWQEGTYKVVFYQQDSIIASFDIEVT